MINPMKLMKIKNAWSRFAANHPKFPLFLNAIVKKGIQEEKKGTIILATVKGDIAEACAIRAVFGDLPVTVSSTKGATGHMMGAGGLTEVITCVQAIRTGLLPPSLGLTEQDPECPLHLTGPTAVQQPVHAAISNAMGFGGQNSCIVVGRYQE